MNLSGIVKNGVIILDDGHSLPEGTHVRVSVVGSTLISSKHRVTFPLVPSKKPGSVQLTNTMIGEILDAEDAEQFL